MEISTLVMASQWIGCAFGILGSLALARGATVTRVFVFFLVSNLFWICFAVLAEAPGLLVMQVAFTATSVYGLYRSMGIPWLRKRFARLHVEPPSHIQQAGK